MRSEELGAKIEFARFLFVRSAMDPQDCRIFFRGSKPGGLRTKPSTVCRPCS